MYAVFVKEIRQFFSSLIGYLAVGIFLTVMGLFMWIFPDTSVLEFGFTTMDGFFAMSPYVFMFLIPAITMRMFAEEIGSGTIELLSTRPLTDLQVILGKYFAALVLVLFALLPTILYYFTLSALSSPPGNIDSGGIMGSYFGLFFLGAVFVAIGLFASSLTGNQIVSFLFGVFLCFLLFLAFDFLARLGIFFGKSDYLVEQLGMSAHYSSMSRGVIDSRDVIYFLSLIALFIASTQLSLSAKR